MALNNLQIQNHPDHFTNKEIVLRSVVMELASQVHQASSFSPFHCLEWHPMHSVVQV